ncbi:hypothetical protein KAS42_02435 [bacterium]|nr:hypothetical protein [bacterium]
MDEKSHRRPKWPLVIGVFTLLYGLFLCLFYHPSENATILSIICNIGVIVFMICGAIGIILHRSWGSRVLVLGSWLYVLEGISTIFVVVDFMGGPPPIFVILGILTTMIPLYGWPVFLLIWFARHKLNGGYNVDGKENNPKS